MGRKLVSQKNRRVYLDERGKFARGNPGKPHGAISYRTRFLISVDLPYDFTMKSYTWPRLLPSCCSTNSQFIPYDTG